MMPAMTSRMASRQALTWSQNLATAVGELFSFFKIQRLRWMALLFYALFTNFEMPRRPPEQFGQCQLHYARWKRKPLQTVRVANKFPGRASNGKNARRRWCLTFWLMHNR